MRKSLLLLATLVLFTLENCCLNPYGCCNPDLSKIKMQENIKMYFPYQEDSNFKLVSADSFLIASIINLTFKDSVGIYYGGDECPSRPIEYYKCDIAIGDKDTASLETWGHPSTMKFNLENIEFLLFYSYPDSIEYYVKEESSTSVHFQTRVKVQSHLFENVLQVKNPEGSINELYFKDGLGIIGMMKDSVLYTLN